jgi:D-psicose/D-tagatose/L-ribulose 3-epimerase
MRHCVDVTAAMGGVQFSGVIYGMHRKRPSGRPALQDWQWSAECLSAVADHAAAEGVRLALEPCNRYETPLINTCEQATRLIQMVGRENVGIHLDTYHMNVEERSWTDPVLLAGSRLFHIHLCENDRGIPGSGHVDWNALFHALALIHYRGYAGLEAFVNVSPEMVASRCVWRDVASSPDVYIREGVAFVREFARLYNI